MPLKKRRKKRTLNIPDVCFCCRLKLNETQLFIFHHIQIVVRKSVLIEIVTYFHVIKNYFYGIPNNESISRTFIK